MDELQKAIEAKLLKEILEEGDIMRRYELLNAYREFAGAVAIVQEVKLKSL